MLGLGSLIGAGLKVGSSIFGGIKASQEMKKIGKNLEERKGRNQDWYDRRYNEDATQRADMQRLLSMTEDSIRNRNKRAEGAQAVMGGTEESVAASKAANNKAYSDLVSNVAALAEQRKDDIESRYQDNDADISDKMNNLRKEKTSAISDAVKGASDAAAELAEKF